MALLILPLMQCFQVCKPGAMELLPNGEMVDSWRSGFIFELTDSYDLAVLLSIAVSLAGGVTFQALSQLPKG